MHCSNTNEIITKQNKTKNNLLSDYVAPPFGEICLILVNDIVLSDALCGVFNCKVRQGDLLKLGERISISLIYL